MPRRKKAFIDRSRARTYEIVYRPLGDDRDGPERVLRAVPRGNASDPRFADAGDVGDTIAYSEADATPLPASEEQYSRDRVAYELGEFGLPDDGYDYSRHFKRIGGGAGAVFVEKGGRTDAGGEGCKEVDAIFGGERLAREEDARRKKLATFEMSEERKVDKDLDEVLAVLEASSVDENEFAEDEDDESVLYADAEESSESDLDLDDDFVSKARAIDSSPGPIVEAAVTPAVSVHSNLKTRPTRQLDDKFDELMRMYEGHDCGEEDAASRGDSEDGVEAANAVVSNDTVSSGDDLDEEFEGRSELDDGMLEALAADLPPGVARVDNNLDHAMKHLIGQYKRATIDETYVGPDSVRAPEALEGVRKAAARHFQRGGDVSSRLPPTDSHGNNIGEYESEEDEADEDYATVFETVVERHVADKWDCETILSTYTNVENHPSVIDDGPGGCRNVKSLRRRDPIIQLDPRTSLPVEYMPPPPEDAAEDDDGYYAERTNVAASHVPVRNKKETAEAKRARKAAAKAAARERRAEKSATKKAFSEEFKKQGAHEVRLGKSKVAVRF